MSHLSWVTIAVICLLLPFAQLQAAASAWSPLLRATFNGDLNTVRILLNEGRNINQRDDEGSTPLMVAASRGHIAIAREFSQNEALLALQDEMQQAQSEEEQQPTEAEWRRQQVAELLRQADEQLAAWQLITPAGDNAFESYRRVLELEPGNTKAKAGLARVAGRYAQLVRRRQVTKLLKQADEQLAAERLIGPAGNNAWQSYRWVLKLEPNNAKAEAGLAQIAEHYRQLAQQRQEAGELETSLAAIDKGLQVRPQDKALLALQEEVQQAKVEEQRQRAKAERRRQVAELLEQAEAHLAAKQFTEPAGGNAWESYQQILALEPDNTAAQAGLQRLLGQAKQILNEKIRALNHTEQEIEVEEQAIRLSIQRTLAQEWEQYSKQTASQ